MGYIRCNWCMTVMEETADNQVYECVNCGSDEYLMDGFIESEYDHE